MGCCCKLSIEYVTWLQYIVMRTYPIVVHKLFNGIVICRLCSFEKSHGKFPLYSFLLSTVVTCCIEFCLYFFIWNLGDVVHISFTHAPSLPRLSNVWEPCFNPHIHRTLRMVFGVQSPGQEKIHASNVINAPAQNMWQMTSWYWSLPPVVFL